MPSLAPPTSRPRARGSLAAAVVVACVGCHHEAGTAASATTSAGATSSKVSPSSAPPAGPSTEELARELARDPLFTTAARTRDPVDLVALGEHAGATALLSLLGDKALRPTVLGALPFTRDSDLALRPLAAIARAGSGDEAFEILDTVARTLEEPRKIQELLDPDGLHLAATDFAAIAKDTARPERERALAVTILGRLSDRGFVTRAEIPAL